MLFFLLVALDSPILPMCLRHWRAFNSLARGTTRTRMRAFPFPQSLHRNFCLFFSLHLPIFFSCVCLSCSWWRWWRFTSELLVHINTIQTEPRNVHSHPMSISMNIYVLFLFSLLHHQRRCRRLRHRYAQSFSIYCIFWSFLFFVCIGVSCFT